MYFVTYQLQSVHFIDFLRNSFQANEVLGYRSKSMALYSKSIILLTFILQEAPTLTLNPPFSPSPSDEQRIHSYIANLKSHLCSAQVAGQQQRIVHN